MYHRDEVDVKKIIQTALQVEDESHKLKAKHTGAKHESLYTDYKPIGLKEARNESKRFIEKNKKQAAEANAERPGLGTRRDSRAKPKPVTAEDKKIRDT